MTVELEQRKTKLIEAYGDMADNRAERMVKASPEWMDRITMGWDARAKASLLRARLEYIHMRQRMDQSPTGANSGRSYDKSRLNGWHRSSLDRRSHLGIAIAAPRREQRRQNGGP